MRPADRARDGAAWPRTGRPCGSRAGSPRRGSGLRTASELLRAAGRGDVHRQAHRPRRVVIAEPDPKGLTRSSGRPGARRARRDGLEVDSAALITQGLRLLDGPLRAAPPLERLEGLATSLGATLRAAAAAISLCTARRGLHRDAVPARPPLRPLVGRAPRASTAPATGSTSARARARAAGRRRDRCTCTRATAAPTPPSAPCSASWEWPTSCSPPPADGRGSWLLEMYGDAQSADLSLVDGALRLLLRSRGAAGERAAHGAPRDGEPARRAVGPGGRPRGPTGAVPRRSREILRGREGPRPRRRDSRCCRPAVPAAAVPIPEGGRRPARCRCSPAGPPRSTRSRCRIRRGIRSWRRTGARTCTSTATSPTSTRARGRWGRGWSGGRRSSRACARR
jgi:hypothetical protein